MTGPNLSNTFRSRYIRSLDSSSAFILSVRGQRTQLFSKRG